MTRLIDGLRNFGHALVVRCAAAMLRHRMRRAQAHLPPRRRIEAAFWRARFSAREARLQRERIELEARRESGAPAMSDAPAAQTLDKAEVLAAIARGRARREARTKAAHEQESR